MEKGTFTDPRDGKTYKTVAIGKQIWMAENLNYNATGSMCYGNNSANCDKYGRLYDWNTAMKACPKGWHLPSKEEWQELVDLAGGNEIAGKKLKAVNGWDSNGNGTDEYDFSALPGGIFINVGLGYNFNMIGAVSYWWSSTSSGDNAYFLSMADSHEKVNGSSYNKSSWYSVRCVQDFSLEKLSASEWMEMLGEGFDNTSKIIMAITNSRVDVLDLFVTNGLLDVHAKLVDGATYMHIAASLGSVKTMKWLQEHNVSVNAQQNNGDMPIHLAAGCGYIEVVDWLLKNGANVNSRGFNYKTPMHKAAEVGKVEMMRYLKERGADIFLRDNGDFSIIETAMTAVVGDIRESIKCLKELGMDLDVKNSEGETPMFSAAIFQTNNREKIKCLATLGADVNARNKYGYTPLFAAAFAGKTESIKCLVDLVHKMLSGFGCQYRSKN